MSPFQENLVSILLGLLALLAKVIAIIWIIAMVGYGVAKFFDYVIVSKGGPTQTVERLENEY